MKVYIEPNFQNDDKGDGGVRRVVDAQRRWLPELGVEIVDELRHADVVNVHMSMPKSTERFLQQFTDVPLVGSSHGFYWAEHEWADWCQKANTGCMEMVRQADVVTAPSEWVAQTIRRNSRRRVVVIGHGIDLEEWPEPEDYAAGGPVLWNKTRVDPICDPESINVLATRMPEVHFVTTFGEKADNVMLTGTLPYAEAKGHVQLAGVYLCTAMETFGIGTLEAMACGVPVLGWRWGGQVEIVEHKVTGYLATPGDYDDLLEGLSFCLEHKEQLGRSARRVVEERYQWQQVVPQYLALYEQVVTQAARRRQEPKVSIIVPAYNLAQYLPEALDSVLAQDTDDWECIVVDDASPDQCGEIAEGYAQRDVRFKVIHNAENQYLAGALNTGISAARGQYIIPLDADNMLPSHTVRLLAGFLDEDRSLHIAYGNVEFLEPDGRRWHSGWPPAFRADWQVLRPAGRDKPNNLIPSTSMYRREVWELTGGYRTRWRTAEDADFWTRATSYGFRARMVMQGDALVYRNRDDAMGRTETPQDWTLWYPWSRELSTPPAAIPHEPQMPIPSYLPVAVSIVIPVGPGHEKLLVDALDSVDAQVYRRWECIVVNDTGKPLGDMLPSWAKVINTVGERGVAAARNMGIRASQAPLFLPLDADDTIEAEALVHLVRAQEEFGGYAYCDWWKRTQGKEMEVWETAEYDAHLLLRQGSLHAVTALYPRSAWEQVGGFDESVPAWEDWDFQLALANIGVCGTRVPRPLFTYRTDTGQRREENVAAFEHSKQGILDKWGDYFEGRKELMGCRGCPGGGKGKVAAPPIVRRDAAAPLPEEDDKYVLVEYTGPKEGTMNFQGRSSGTSYRFSNRPDERQKLVLKADAEFFEAHVNFKVVRTTSPVTA